MLATVSENPAFFVPAPPDAHPWTAVCSTFVSLIAPLGPADFLRRYWERAPFCIQRKQSHWYSGLLSSRDVDFLCCQTRLRPQDVGVDQTRPDGSAEYKAAAQTDLGRVDIAGLYDNYSRGATLLLGQLHLHWEPIAALCRDLHAYFRSAVGANAYLTPPGAQSSMPHFDPDDVFIVQLEGRKTWRIHGPVMAVPLPEHARAVTPEEIGPPRYEIEVQAGDLLYLPRGHVHEARTTDTASLHLTLGVHTTTWLDMLSAALRGVGERLEVFRQGLPPGLFDDAPSQAVARERFLKMLTLFAEHASFADSVDRLADRFFDELRPLPAGQWLDHDLLNGITLDTVLGKRPGVFCRVRETENGTEIQFPGSTVKGPALIAPALSFVALAERFAVRDLPELSAASKLVLARRLVKDGLLQIMEPTI